MLLYAKYAATVETKIILHSPDTKVLLLSAVHFDRLGCEDLWLRCGVKLIGYELFLYTKSPEHWAKNVVTLFL